MENWSATMTTTDGWGTVPGGPNDSWGSVPVAAAAGNTSGFFTGGTNGMKSVGEDNMDGRAGGAAAGFGSKAPTYTNGSFGDGTGDVIDANGGEAQKCFNCGESGHLVAECPNPRSMECRFCKNEGHMVRDCPDKPPMICENCGLDGHTKRSCQNARKVNRDHVKDLSPEEAWEKLQKAVTERDLDDTKEAVQEYVKSLDGAISYRDLQEAMLEKGIDLFFIATERDLVKVFTNMDLQGNMGKKYSISYRFSEKPDRPREAESFPKNREELFERLDDAGEIVNSGQSVCHNCGELGHVSKFCTEEKTEKPVMPKICCNNCDEEGHRLRDCPKPRVDKFACKNCGKSGHKVADCEEPPNLDNVECRRCHEMGHFSKDCPTAGPRGCHNCGSEDHVSRDCDQPRNMDRVTCRNCEKQGHMSRDCPEPRDWSKVQCTNCQQFGHTKVRCKEPPCESEDYQNRADDKARGGFDNTGGGVGGGGGPDSWGGEATAGEAVQPSSGDGGW